MEFTHIFSKFLGLVLLISCFTKGNGDPKVFHLEDYGVVEGGKVDISQALLKAWADTCKWKGPAQLDIPSGTYLVSPVVFEGPCNGPVEFQNKGNLRAPLGLKGPDHWISFEYVNGLIVDGGGSFNGLVMSKGGDPNLPTLLRFSFVTNARVENVKLLNSQSTHFHLFGCNDTTINKVVVSAPGETRNTDGIKIGESERITISNSTIASGDDCVALLRGSKNITITGLTCGPGHGISIGSMGGLPDEQVDHVKVLNCNFSQTTNGVRIKTWASNNPGLVSRIHYSNLFMDGVENPIIIDQNYCPPRTCAQGNSRVQIRNVKYDNIYGTSKTNIAVNLQCSGSNPCQKIILNNIDIKYDGSGVATTSQCSHVNGESSGVQVPKSCI